MDTRPFLEAAAELRGRFFDLIDSLSALRSLSDLDVQHQTEQAMTRQAVELLLEHEDFERCSIFLLRGKTLECAAGADWDALFVASGGNGNARAAHPHAFAVGEGLMGLAARSREIQHCPDCASDARYKVLEAAGVPPPRGSLICAPVLSHGEVLGVVNAYNGEANRLEPWHERLLALFCGVLGHMLSNHRLLVRMEQSVRERTRQLEAALRVAEQLRLRYEQLSNVDELTALHNRRFFFPEAEAAVSRATRYGHPFSLLILDIDHFKRINDTHGHSLGDMVLRDVAGALKENVREGDILARFGGEEFVVALPNTERGGARQLAERILEAVRTLAWEAPSGALSITISGGISSLEGRSDTSHKSLLDQLIKEADLALYRAKRLGRDRIETVTDPREDGAPR